MLIGWREQREGGGRGFLEHSADMATINEPCWNEPLLKGSEFGVCPAIACARFGEKSIIGPFEQQDGCPAKHGRRRQPLVTRGSSKRCFLCF